jgi:ribosomal-protein-alanine N-acetyltransferase
VADGASASPELPRLLAQVHAQLTHAGITEALAIVHPQDWLLSYLQDAGYTAVDRMLTYEASPARIAAPAAPPGVSLRPVFARDLHTVCELDARSFEPAWRYPPAIMQPAFDACAVFTLAEWHGAAVGYCCALLNDEHGHVVRLAVDEQHRRAGIGAALLDHMVQSLGRQGALTVSLNTQAANKASQRVYLRMGFNELLERPMVLRKQLAQQTSRAQA